jgi:Transposase DDE domain
MQGTEATQPPTTLEIRGLKYFKKLLPLFARLHEVGCARDTAGNRKLHFDQYAALVMLYLFNPLIGSLRTLQQSLGLPKVAQTLGLEQFSLGSFSEAPAVFEPQRLQEIIAELAAEARPLAIDPRLADLKQALTLVDGTMLAALPKLAQAAALGTRYAGGRDGKDYYAWRLHTQLELKLPYPLRIDVTGAGKAGDNRENQVLRRSLEAERCYVTDAGYADYGLFDEIVNIGSSYVCRVREDSALEVLEERELSQEALAAGIVRDVIVKPGGRNSPPRQHPVRILVIQVTPRPRRTRRAEGVKVMGSRSSDLLVIATNLLELPAELVALIYQQRYAVELFFRFLKGLLGMRHLLSQREAGVEIQSYCTIIACLLINLWTGRKPNKRTVEMIGWYLIGLASEQDVIDFLNKPDNTGVKKRAKDELWKKLGVN